MRYSNNLCALLTGLFCFVCSFLYGQDHPTRSTNGATFVVDEVELAEELLETFGVDEFHHLKFPGAEAVSKAKAEYIYPDLYDCSQHPVIQSLFKAFYDHRPLTLSPDMIWLMITQTFARHVEKNSGKLKPLIVEEGVDSKIVVRRDDFVKGKADNPWPEVFGLFSEKIGERTQDEIAEIVTAPFSTTGINEQAAFDVTLMDTVSEYFEYDFYTMCGIPSITLTGTPNDWAAIRNRANKLRQYDLDEWIDKLDPILAQFHQASMGNPDTTFWQSIFSEKGMSGGVPHVSGWIIEFFPFAPREYPAGFGVEQADKKLGVLVDEFPSGLGKADFTWHYLDDEFEMELVAGFIGVEQDPKTMMLTPAIGWAVRETKYNRDNAVISNPFMTSLIVIGFIFVAFIACMVKIRSRNTPRLPFTLWLAKIIVLVVFLGIVAGVILSHYYWLDTRIFAQDLMMLKQNPTHSISEILSSDTVSLIYILTVFGASIGAGGNVLVSLYSIFRWHKQYLMKSVAYLSVSIVLACCSLFVFQNRFGSHTPGISIIFSDWPGETYVDDLSQMRMANH